MDLIGSRWLAWVTVGLTACFGEGWEDRTLAELDGEQARELCVALLSNGTPGWRSECPGSGATWTFPYPEEPSVQLCLESLESLLQEFPECGEVEAGPYLACDDEFSEIGCFDGVRECGDWYDCLLDTWNGQQS